MQDTDHIRSRRAPPFPGLAHEELDAKVISQLAGPLTDELPQVTLQSAGQARKALAPLLPLCQQVNRPLFWRETVVLKQLAYRNRNAHLTTVHFRKLHAVFRDIKLVQANDVNVILTILAPTLASLVESNTVPALLPSRFFLVSLNVRFARLILVLKHLIEDAAVAYQAFFLLLSRGTFMSLAVVVISSLSRLQSQARLWILEMEKAYDLIMTQLTFYKVRLQSLALIGPTVA
ncbi:hypothetical protein IWQ60_003834 [Tieghemiomyces parasiticus]|uniref:Nucleolus and neural progenitor protein-like N-terminal domain-containing protein n=1 Tax=Tieghemiomyces parasiticus TaxID=78921 RepID=A0A9W8A9F3_9FUNG|nr:hypothetical protein IWQ60_003834 [Tieghemiomyces parasiticus]